MKKIINILITFVIIMMSFSMVACSEPIETVSVYGEFKTLQEAFAEKLISVDDFQDVSANIDNPAKYSVLDDEIKEKILHDYKQMHAHASDESEVFNYGKYGDCYIVWINDVYYGNVFDETMSFQSKGYPIFNNRNEIEAYGNIKLVWLRVWKEYESLVNSEKPEKPNGAFYSMKRAYELGFFTLEQFKSGEMFDWDNEPFDWSETKNKIINDYSMLNIESNLGLKNYIPEVKFGGNYNGFTVIRLHCTLNGNPYGDSVKVQLTEDYYYESYYPLSIIWRPFEE